MHGKLVASPPASGQGSKHPATAQRREWENRKMDAWLERCNACLKLDSHAPAAAPQELAAEVEWAEATPAAPTTAAAQKSNEEHLRSWKRWLGAMWFWLPATYACPACKQEETQCARTQVQAVRASSPTACASSLGTDDDNPICNKCAIKPTCQHNYDIKLLENRKLLFINVLHPWLILYIWQNVKSNKLTGVSIPGIIIVLFLFKEQRDVVGTWLCPAKQNCIMFKNKSRLAHISRHRYAPWERSQSFPNRTFQEHTPDTFSVCLNFLNV